MLSNLLRSRVGCYVDALALVTYEFPCYVFLFLFVNQALNNDSLSWYFTLVLEWWVLFAKMWGGLKTVDSLKVNQAALALAKWCGQQMSLFWVYLIDRSLSTAIFKRIKAKCIWCYGFRQTWPNVSKVWRWLLTCLHNYTLSCAHANAFISLSFLYIPSYGIYRLCKKSIEKMIILEVVVVAIYAALRNCIF